MGEPRRYRVSGTVLIAVHTEVEARNPAAARLAARDLPVMSLCHQCASEPAKGQWVTSGELDGEVRLTPGSTEEVE